jgi:hypothetical protein
MKNIFFAFILMNYGIANSENVKIYLKCESVVTQNSQILGESKNNFLFDLVISETKDGIEFSSSKSSIGGSIFFGTSPFYLPKITNIKNYSSPDIWDYEFSVAHPNRKIFSRNKFTLNRFTGSLIVEYVGEDSGVVAKSEGYCKKAQSKLF